MKKIVIEGVDKIMEFLMVLFIFPFLSFLFGIVGQIVINKIYIVVGITFIGWLIATFTIFNYSFMIWVFILYCLWQGQE